LEQYTCGLNVNSRNDALKTQLVKDLQLKSTGIDDTAIEDALNIVTDFGWLASC